MMRHVLWSVIVGSGVLAVLTQWALGWRAHQRRLVLLARTAPRDDLVAALFVAAATLLVCSGALVLITAFIRVDAWMLAKTLCVSSNSILTTAIVAGVFAGWPFVGRVQLSILTYAVSSNVLYIGMLLLNALIILRSAG